MTGRRVWDISQTLSSALPVWPGDTPFSAEFLWSYGPNCPVNVSKLQMSTHGGTHADAPLHYDAGGKPICDLSLEPYMGRARVLDLRGSGNRVTADMVRPALEDGVERLLLRTYNRFPHDEWVNDFCSISPEAIYLIAARGVILIGTDAPSVDPQNSKTLDAHQAVNKADLRILEGLVLEDVPPGDYELIALPLKFAGLDASPVRAVLRELP